MNKTSDSKQHHWWPKSVSQYWAGEDGCVSRMDSHGQIKRLPYGTCGHIGNAHKIKLSANAEETHWDYNYEHEFQPAYDHFHHVISALYALEAKPFNQDADDRFLEQHVSDDTLCWLIEGLVSLVVRGPRFREACVSLAEHLRGPLPERERNALISANQRHCQRRFADHLKGRGKVAILYTDERELIFGDGFYHTITSPTLPMTGPTTILAPLTPTMAALYTYPTSYKLNPKLVTTKLNSEEVNELNCTVKIYSKNYVFFRSQKPDMDEAFAKNEHLVFKYRSNFIDTLMEAIPGIRSNIFCGIPFISMKDR